VYVYCEGFRIGVAIYLYVEQLLFQGKMFTEIQGRRNGGALRGHRCPYIPVSQVISWFMKINLKQIYCNYSCTPKIQDGFL